MKRIMTILVLALCACSLQLTAKEANVVSGSIKPRAYYKAAAFELKQGDKIEVTAQGPQELSIDIYVYAESTRNLAAKSDDDATELFSWKAPQDDRYYVM